MQSRQEDQCRKLHDKVEGLSERNRGLMLENETLQRQVSTMWMCLFISVTLYFHILGMKIDTELSNLVQNYHINRIKYIF